MVTAAVHKSNASSIVRIARTSSRVGTRTMLTHADYGFVAAMLRHEFPELGGGVQLT
ncbi:MAG: hypothetical protein M3N49_13935 [Candidatus Eremiobacteraeota bacterium]|nr:hypothetical protein [Candidatus Eremiobacteraeota bacterium]